METDLQLKQAPRHNLPMLEFPLAALGAVRVLLRSPWWDMNTELQL
jgi:hypothetical protein